MGLPYSRFMHCASLIALTYSVTPTMAQAQDAAVQNAEADIIVTGVRASLDRAIDIKRNSSGGLIPIFRR